MSYNPYANYKEQSVMTMTQGEMLTSLFDETVKQLHKAVLFIQQGNHAETHESLVKAQKIVSHLRMTLDDQYPISKELTVLYNYYHDQMVKANINKDASYVEEIIPMIMELRNTFKEADRISRMK